MDRFTTWVVLSSVATLAVLAPLGWVCNIIKLAHADSITGWVILRAVGVPVVPLGVVLGFL